MAAAGAFADGSMGPKIEAACRFAETGGRRRHHVVAPHRRSTVRNRRNDRHVLTGHREGSWPQGRRNPSRSPARRSTTCPIRSRFARSRCTTSPTRASWPDCIDDGVLDADRVVAVIGKTEGNGGVNDYTRILADRAFREVLVAKGSRSADEVKQVPIVWSGGTDGVISPHATIFATVTAGRRGRDARSRGSPSASR